jgi:outer membrane protein assembly factor BamB
MPETQLAPRAGAAITTGVALRRRWWIPGTLLGALVIYIVVIRTNGALAESRDAQVGLQWIGYTVGFVLLLGWFLFLGGYSRRAKLLGIAGVMLAFAAFRLVVRNVDLSGDLVPTLEYRWDPPADAILVEHRRNHPAQGPLELPEITAELLAHSSLGYRGAQRDGRVGTQGIVTDWSQHPPQAVWRQPVGGGYSSFAVLGPVLVTLEQRELDEALVAYDTATGAERWVYRYPAYFTSVLSGEGPRATPCIAEDRVFSVGALGRLVCVDLATGELQWQVDLFAENGMSQLDAGIAASPLVVGPNVVVAVGAQGGSDKTRAMLAFDRASGTLAWSGGRAGVGYVSPMLVTIGGREQILIYDRMGLAGYDPNDGAELWRFELVDDVNIVAAQPVLIGEDRVFFASDVEALLIQLAPVDGKWMAKPLWRTNTLRCAFCSPVAVGDSLYGLDKGIMACVDLATGQRRWKRGRFGNGQVLLVDDSLLIQGEMGEVALVAADPREFKELGRFDGLAGKTWNIPTLVDGRLYLRNHHEMVCYDMRPAAQKREVAGP